MNKLSRRTVALGAVAAPFLNLGGAFGQTKRKVTFTLSWVPDGSNAYAYVAKDLGYWDELGLDVQISRGYGSVASAQAVGSGQFQFGLAAASAAIQQVAKGLPLISLATCGYDATACVLSLESNDAIRSPKDLNGKKMATTTSSGEYPFLPLFAEKAGFDLKSVDMTQTDPIVRQRLLVSKQVDAISCFAISAVPTFVYNKVEPRIFSYRKAGIILYNYALLTKPETLKAEPKLCTDFANGLLKAVKFSMLEPDAAVKSFLKQLPEMALTAGIAEQTRIGLGMTSATVLDDMTLKHGLGYADPAGYESMTDLVMRYVASPGDPRPKTTDLFTNTDIGNVTFTPDEWTKAQAIAEPTRKYIG